MNTVSNAYAVRNEIKAAGGRWNGSEWELTDEQLAVLAAEAARSHDRSNKRDRAFGVAFAAVKIVDGDNVTTGADAMAPTLAQLAAEFAAFKAVQS